MGLKRCRLGIEPQANRSKVKVIPHILVTANASWNIWNFRTPIIQALLDDGHEVTIAAPVDESTIKLKNIGCRFVPLPMDVRGLNPITDAALVKRFVRVLKSNTPDVVLSYTIKNNVFVSIAGRILNIPVIPNVTGLGTAFLSNFMLHSLATRLYRVAFSKHDTVFFQNTDDRNLFIDRSMIRSDQATVLPGSGINLDKYAFADYPTGGPITFLMISRLIRDKGVFEFVEAAKSGPYPSEVRFRLLGPLDAKNRSAIDSKIVRQWVADGIIEYLGNAADVRPFIADAHCIVLPSYREGAPRTLLEAAAMGRPVITTDVPGCRSVLDPGLSGLLCEARSSASLSQAMASFLSHTREQRAAMGKAGRDKMEREFDEEIIVQHYRAAIERALMPRLARLEGS